MIAIKESWLPIFDTLSKIDKKRVRDELTSSGIDIENMEYTETRITSGRDSRLRGPGVVIVEFDKDDTAVWFRGRFIVDPYVRCDSGWNNISKMSWKWIVANCKATYYIEFNEAQAADLRDKQARRKDAQTGRVIRYTNANKPRYTRLDKSGYIIDPGKYRRMFAELQLNNPETVLTKASNIYTQLAAKMPEIDFDTDYEYQRLIQGIPNAFSTLTRCLKRYNKYKDSEDGESYWHRACKMDVTDAVANLRDYIRTAEKYL